MSRYTLVITKTAVKDLESLSEPAKRRLKQKLAYFLEQPDALSFANRLVNSKIGTFRWRVGDYRVSFDVDGATIVVLRIRHRRDIYRR
ncbi:MAG TPA: type II toxin-antitoxin system RelE/ParE family toxin [Candidatus Saccharimonadales bacterium]|jgi:mRNA interferase RelE/StbE